MIDGIVRFIGCINIVVFFVSDFFFAYVLHQLKQDHPAIDECAPESDEIDTVAILSGLHRAATTTASSASGGAYSGIDADDNGFGIGDSDPSRNRERNKMIHRIVIVASFSAPLFSLLQIMVPMSMQWSMFDVPSWLGYLSVIPGLGVCMFYASRALRVSNFEDVSKAQWLAMMWFRLDMMCVMATVLLLGWGDWLVAVCLFAVALYLAHRLLMTERRLSAEMKSSQLIREEMNLESLKPTPAAAAAARGDNGATRKTSSYDAIGR